MVERVVDDVIPSRRIASRMNSLEVGRFVFHKVHAEAAQGWFLPMIFPYMKCTFIDIYFNHTHITHTHIYIWESYGKASINRRWKMPEKAVCTLL